MLHVRYFLLLALLPGCLILPNAFAHETDQFTHRNESIADSSAIMDQRMNAAIDRALDRVKNHGCSEGRLLQALHSEVVGNFLDKKSGYMPKLQTEIERDPLVDRRDIGYRNSIYHAHDLRLFHATLNVLRFNFWYSLWGIKPVIRVGDVEIGTDKIGHFLEAGYIYYDFAQSARRLNLSQDQIDAQVLGIGEKLEDTAFGLLATGVKSYGDMNANFEGYRFLKNLFHGEIPYLSCQNNELVRTRDFHWSEYVTPLWDESINCSTFVPTIRKIVNDHLSRLGMSCPVTPDACIERGNMPHARHLVGPACRALAKPNTKPNADEQPPEESPTPPVNWIKAIIPALKSCIQYGCTG